MNDLIQALMNNKFTVFAGWSPEMQAKAKEIRSTTDELGKQWFEVYTKTYHWSPTGKGVIFLPSQAYRLVPDYTEKPSVVECEVYNMNGHLHFKTTDQVHSLHQAMDESDFIGFKYGDGKIRATPRVYVHTTGNYNYMTYGEFDTCKILTPTHVLFKGATK